MRQHGGVRLRPLRTGAQSKTLRQSLPHKKLGEAYRVPEAGLRSRHDALMNTQIGGGAS